MSDWEVAQPLDYSATGDDIDSASQKIIATFADVYDKLNRLRKLDASADHTVGDAAPYSIKIDTSVTPAAILMRNADNTGYVQIGSVAANLGITASDVGAITGSGMGKMSLGSEQNLPATATTYDMYFAYDTGRLYMYLTGAWRVFLSLRFEDLLGVSDSVITWDEVAENGANKIPRLNSAGQGEFDITGNAAKLGGKDMYLPSITDNQVLVFNGARDRWEAAPRDDLTNDDVSTTGEPNKIVKTDSTSKAHVDITGNAAKIATKTIDVSNLQDGDVLVYDATHGTFVNKQGAVVNAQGVVEANVSGSAAKWGGKVIQTVSLTDGQILVWSESNQAFINRNQGSIGSARSLVINQDGEEKANYNGDTYRNINIITPHLRVASQEYTANQTCFSKNMASTLYLECTTPGVTAAVEPDFSSASIGDTVADGGVVWTVRGYVDTTVTDAIRTDVTALQSIQTHNYRQPSTEYDAGVFRYNETLPAGWYLECTTAGTSDSGALTITTPAVGNSVTDGTAVWTIRSMGDDSMPIGTIVPFTGSTNPAGYLECNGAAVSRTMYPDLFALIGTTYGAGDGSTTFNLPDNSTTVQPPALTMRYVIKAFHGQTADSALIDITQYANELAGKLPISSVPLVAGYNQKQTFTSSGSFTAPITGLYKITLQGGGGGGASSSGSSSTSMGARGGGGGGEGARLEFYEQLTAGESYSYTIGAGGFGGQAGSANLGYMGGNGGDSSITINGTVYVAGGGGKGYQESGGGQAGYGGVATIAGVTIDSGQGASGGCGGSKSNGTSVVACGGGGGGLHGGHAGAGAGSTGVCGSGGGGGGVNGSSFNAGGAGGDGYITFEWQSGTI